MNPLSKDLAWAAQCVRSPLAVPTIHLNGTSAERLTEDLANAYSKITEALEALAQTAPNGRDYYVKEAGAFEQAQNEHYARIARLVAVQTELEQIMEGIDAQVRQRDAMRRRP